MKDFISVWRKFTKKVIQEQTDAVKAAEDKLRAAKQTNKATLAYANNIKSQAAQSEQIAQAELEASKKNDADEINNKQMKTGQVAKTGITSSQPLASTVGGAVEETVGYQGEQEDSMGNVPVSNIHEDDPYEVYEGTTDEGELCEIEYEDSEQAQGCGQCEACKQEASLNEAEYKGKKVTLRKKMPGDVKKYKVYVRKPNGKVVKVNFGDKKMRIKKSNPERKKSFMARHRCDNPGPPWKARYWSCRNWK